MIVMADALRSGAWLGLPTDITPDHIIKVLSHIDCLACALAKRNRLPRSQGSGINNNVPGRYLSVDYKGPKFQRHTEDLQAGTYSVMMQRDGCEHIW